MKQKNYETLMYSAVGVAAMVLIVVAVNLIASAFKTRIDLTGGKLYTLSPGTKAILKKLDSPVEVRFYYSRSEARAPSYFKTYAKQIEDLLGEFRQVAGGNLEIKKYDPLPDSEAEDLANLDGVEGQMIETGEKFYLGVAVSMDPNKVAIPFLSPGREKMLEYDLARAVSQVLSTNKPVVGVMTPLPVMGSQMPPQMMMRTGQQPQEPWTFVTELKKDFDVRQVPMDTEKIEDDVKVLLVIHPKDIKETAQYALDQFVMRGGRLIVALDSMCLADSQRSNPMMPAMPGGPSNLDKLLKAWGLTFDTTKVAADMNLARQLVLRRGAPPETMPTWLFLKESAINKEEVVAGQIDEVLMPGAGVFTGTPATGLKKTVLLQTTKNSQLVEGFMAQMAPQKIIDDFKSSDAVHTLALRLEGKFKTAFPEGKPESKPDDKDAPKDADKKPEDKAKDTIKESKTDNAVVLLGDSDWLSDNFSVQVQSIPMLNYKIVQPMNGNLPLVQNLVEQFAGDQNLIGVRSRGTLNRPFTVVQEMQARANARFQQQIANVQKEVDETNQKLNELQGKKEPGQRFVLSKEQQDAMEGFKQKRAQANKELKRVRRDLRKDIDSLELWTKVINIGAVPLAVAIAGVALGFVRKQKTKAQ